MHRSIRAFRSPAVTLATAVAIVFLAAGCAPSNVTAASPSDARSTSSSAAASPSAATTSSAPTSSANAADGTTADSGTAWALNFAGSGTRIKSAGLQILTAEGTAEHYHAHLDIFVNGTKVDVPANIGFAVDASGQATGISALHTHDTSGVLHIEAATAGQEYTLGQLLTEWGILGANGSIAGKTGPGAQGWHVFMGGAKYDGGPTTVTLRPHQEIALVYGSDPAKIPASFAFPAGE